jgi:hypothetical protein
MSDVACQLASVQSDLATALAERAQTLAEFASIQQRLPGAQAELATLQQGQQGIQIAGCEKALHFSLGCWTDVLLARWVARRVGG